MNEQELQQAFIQWLAQKLGVQDEAQLKQAIQKIGQQGLQEAYQQFMQEVQQQQAQKAKFGAKLNYIRSLNGQCPEGTEVSYFKQGGHICKKCVAKQKEEEKQSSVEAFKCGRKMKKAQQGTKVYKRAQDAPRPNDRQLIVGDDKKGYRINTYKDRATRDSVLINKYDQDSEFEVPGKRITRKDGSTVWAPDRTKPPYRKVKK